jgi:hypothetical protein
MTVQKIASWVPVTDEAIVDYQLGTPEEQAAAAARLEALAAERDARWRALPLRTRLYRRLRWSLRG